MKQWQSIKKVYADKIVKIERGGTSRLYLQDGDFVDVDIDYMTKHKPLTGGYFVRYADGYTSFSPADAFEAGYEVYDRRSTFEAFLEQHLLRGHHAFVMTAYDDDGEIRIKVAPVNDQDLYETGVAGNILKR